MLPFSDLPFQTKDKPHRTIYYAKFSKCARFHEIPLQTHKDREAQICLQGLQDTDGYWRVLFK